MRAGSRRKFITSSACLGCALFGARCEHRAETASREVALARLEDLSARRTLFPIEKLVVFRELNEISVMGADCTHQSCMLKAFEREESGYVCVCHGSRFDAEGKVLTGPADRDLPRYRARLNSSGILMVNLADQVSAQWRLRF